MNLPATPTELLDAALSGTISAAPAPDEAAWRSVWQNHRLGHAAPIESALLGGLLANQLSWVFIAGYQAALRAIFDGLPPDGWVAYAATENSEDPATYPGTHIEETPEGWRLYGHKFWVAQSKTLSHLIVTARRGGEERPNASVLVAGNAPGVSLTHREKPRFLANLSQGFAAFDGALTEAPQSYPEESARQFGRTESRYVMLAAAGFMLSQTPHSPLRDRLASIALAIAAPCRTPAIGAQVMAAVDREFQALVAAFDSAGFGAQVPGWQADKRLLTMYSARIQNRAVKDRAARQKAEQLSSASG